MNQDPEVWIALDRTGTEYEACGAGHRRGSWREVGGFLWELLRTLAGRDRDGDGER